MCRTKCAAFSLVELAVVMVISSLLLLGATSTVKLVQRSQVLKLAAELLAIKQATHLFTQKYTTLPGDLNNATQVIRANLINGNGDGYLGSVSLQQNGNWENLNDVGNSSENRNFFTHLQAANMLLDLSLDNDGFALSSTVKGIAMIPRVEFAEQLFAQPLNTITIVNADELHTKGLHNLTALVEALTIDQLTILKKSLDGSQCLQGNCLLEGQLIIRAITATDYNASDGNNCYLNSNGTIRLNPQATRKCSVFLPLEPTSPILPAF